MSNKPEHFIHWDWRDGLRQVIGGEYPLEIATARGAHYNVLDFVGSHGCIFGVVVDGISRLRRNDMLHELDRGQWFAIDTAEKARLETFDISKILLICATGRSNLFQVGGPIELIGRLRYIDGCTDTILVHPWKLGQPCLNHLHFPPGINQTMHTHPSDRVGAVVGGHGWCETPEGTTRLDVGTVFRIPADGLHRFITEAGSMDVIAFHPDSDTGPTDDDHPMVNRTMVQGVSARHIEEIRTRNV